MQRVQLKKQLNLSLPEDLDLTFQELEEFRPGEPVICCWEQDDLQFIVDADDQPGGLEHDDYWTSLESCLRNDAGYTKVRTLKAGSYPSDAGEQISYRIYQCDCGQEREHQVYHLLRNADIAYWILCPLRSLEDIFQVNAHVTRIARTAVLTEDSGLER